jgi:tRNA-specific 2-thiouridylase
MEAERKRALIAMSGGVDSSAAAALMIERGYDCIGVTMKLFAGEEMKGSRTCCSIDDVEDARQAAFRLNMPHYVLNFTEDFEEQVIGRFISIYEAGGTPNPCIDCNRTQKFGKLFGKARELGADIIVTGHYARVLFDEETGRYQLQRAVNRDKDQTYVLYAMTQEELAHTVFPLGEIETKAKVRQIAERYGFMNAEKPDSQDICFVQEGNYADFIMKRTGKKYPHGNFVDEEGHVLGEHKGMIRYTIGQRRGLGLALPEALYVKRKDLERNEIVLAPDQELYSRHLIAEDFNWILSPPELGEELRLTAKPRYQAREASCSAKILPGGQVEILFDRPQRALCPGQAVVLYQGDLTAGGGTITEVS